MADEVPLREYLETRIAALEYRLTELDAIRTAAVVTAITAQEKAVSAALTAADRAVAKAELAYDKRFESVNEFRQTLDDQQRTLMPRSESVAMMTAQADRLMELKEQVDALSAERAGIKGGWGYAVGAVGFLLALGSLGLIGLRFLGR